MSAPEVDELFKEILTLLGTAHDHPSVLSAVLRRAQGDSSNWVPRLIKVVLEDRGEKAEIAIKVLLSLVQAADGLAGLLEIYTQLPRRTTQLAKVALLVTERLLALFPKEEQLLGREAALLWNNLSVRCRENEMAERALQLAEVAVQIAASCANDRDGQRLLARCLLTGANEWAANGEHQRALAAAEYACSLAERLGQEGRPEDEELGIETEVNRASRLSGMGREEEAILCARAVRARILARPLSRDLKQALAFIEMTLASCLNAVGRHTESLPHGEAADQLFRVLSDESPGERLEDTVAAGSNYADALIATGKIQAAHTVLTQALDRLEPFALRWPKRFGRDLSVLRMNLADVKRSLGQFEDAVRLGWQAIGDIRTHGVRSRRRDWQTEGTAANIVFLGLYQLGRMDEAIKAARLALRCFKRLPEDNAEAREDMARTLRYLAEAQLQSGKRGAAQRATAHAQQALDLVSQARRPIPANKLLAAQIHTTLGLGLEAQGRIAEAVAEQQRAVGILREIQQVDARSYQAEVAYSLYRLSRLLLKAEDYSDAKSVASEAISIYGEVLLEGDGEGRVRFMADSARNLAEAQLALKEDQEAVATYKTAIRLLRPLYRQAVATWQPYLLPLCIRYVQVCEARGIPVELTLVADVIRRARAEREGP